MYIELSLFLSLSLLQVTEKTKEIALNFWCSQVIGTNMFHHVWEFDALPSWLPLEVPRTCYFLTSEFEAPSFDPPGSTSIQHIGTVFIPHHPIHHLLPSPCCHTCSSRRSTAVGMGPVAWRILSMRAIEASPAWRGAAMGMGVLLFPPARWGFLGFIRVASASFSSFSSGSLGLSLNRELQISEATAGP